MTRPRRVSRSLAMIACAGVCGAAVTLPSAVAAEPVASARPAAAPDPGTRAVAALVKRMTLEEKVGQLFVQQVYGADANTPDERNVPLYGVAKPADVVKKYHLGGVIHFAWTDSLKNPTQIATLNNAMQAAAVGSGAKIPLTIATDQEQGPVTRLGPPATQLPGAMALGAGRSAKDARTAAAITGAELKAVGINTNYAPDADVNVNAANPVIGVRSFSSDPALVSTMVSAQVKGLQADGKVSATVKHFPGHGDTDVDSHTGLPVITHSKADWSKLDEPPFRAAIKAGVDQIMSAHLVVPALDPSGDPATLSKPIITGVLRQQLGYRGVVVTDSLAMEGVRTKYGDGEVAVKALLAGDDQLLMSPKMDLAYNSVLQAVRSGRLPMQRIDESVGRVLALKWKRQLFAKPYVSVPKAAQRLGTPAHLAQAEAVADRGITMLRNEDKHLPLAPAGRRILVAGYGTEATATLAAELGRRGAQVSTLETGAAPKPATITAAVAKAGGVDDIVLTTMNASTAANAGQCDLFAALQRTGTPVTVVAVRNPYDINVLPQARSYLATYSYNAVSLRAAARVLVGEVTARGVLPVSIPTADGKSTMYPFGAGITR